MLFEGCERKYDNDSKDVVRSTVLTFTPRRAVSETGAKFSTALIPADMIWLRTLCAAFAGTAITITSIDFFTNHFAHLVNIVNENLRVADPVADLLPIVIKQRHDGEV